MVRGLNDKRRYDLYGLERYESCIVGSAHVGILRICGHNCGTTNKLLIIHNRLRLGQTPSKQSHEGRLGMSRV